MNNPPTGQVTFLFNDIEGSTKLAQQFPDSLPSALEKHHKILREAIESNNGFVFEIIGDAFCATFENSITYLNIPAPACGSQAFSR
jgi:class 3 adenylate cyclase